MAIPATIFIKKYSYKSGILLGLALYSIAGGSLMPLLQGLLVDSVGVELSYLMSIVCFVVITILGLRTLCIHNA